VNREADGPINDETKRPGLRIKECVRWSSLWRSASTPSGRTNMRRPGRDAGMGKRTGSRKKESRYDIDMSKGESNLGRLFKEINHLIEQAARSKNSNNSEISLTGEITGLASRENRVLYGFSVKLEKRAKK
jgi:hypothetical protein